MRTDTAADALTGATEPGQVVLLVGRPAPGSRRSWRRLESVPVHPGTLVAVDYLQLIQGPDDVGARIAELADRRGLRMVLGAMAPRSVAAVATDGQPAEVLRVFADHIEEVRPARAVDLSFRPGIGPGSPGTARPARTCLPSTRLDVRVTRATRGREC